MKNFTFDTLKSSNIRYHNKLVQQDEYDGYVKRLGSIVDRKYKMDLSSDFYMTFLNKSRQKSKQQQNAQKQVLVQLQNRHLLEKIQKEKNRKIQKNTSLYQINYLDKRVRDQLKINDENTKMAQRIMKQDSYLINKKILVSDYKTNSPDKGITNQIFLIQGQKIESCQSSTKSHNVLTTLQYDDL